MDSPYASEIERVSCYAQGKVDAILRDMLEQLFLQTPDDPIDFMIGFLSDYKERSEHEGLTPTRQLSTRSSGMIEQFDLDSCRSKGRRRTAVSAEPVDVLASVQAPETKVEKTDEQIRCIQESIRNNILFSSLNPVQIQQVLDSMQKKDYLAGETIIKQGEQGDYFYLLDSGIALCFVAKDGGEPRLVKTYLAGESFGELALMYNSPRAATITAQTDVSCWALDRITFRKVLMETTSSTRSNYEHFLSEISILSSLDQSERARVADALVERHFHNGEYVIHQGEVGDQFHIIIQGCAKVTKSLNIQPEEVTVLELATGDYFGELALINDDNRAANVIAVGELTTVTLDRGSFTRLLGPIDHVLKRNQDNYNEIEQMIYAQKLQDYDATYDDGVPQRLQSISGFDVDIHGAPIQDRRRRTGVCSEPVAAMALDDGLPVPHVPAPKTPQQRAAILKSIQDNFLFTGLDTAQQEIIMNAMFQKVFRNGDYIIRQGQPGNHFYILDKGEAECFVQRRKDEPPALVKVYKTGEGFGELALMYNSPRAASIIAKGDVTAWVVYRRSFRRVLMDTTNEKRTLYEGFLGSVKILSSLDRSEIAKVADCLLEKTYEPGEYVIRQNEPGENFYIVVDGEAIATKNVDNEHEKEVMRYKRGDYFGELALLNDKLRAANVIAVGGPLKVVTLDRASFTRLLGPCEEILEHFSRAVDEYRRAE